MDGYLECLDINSSVATKTNVRHSHLKDKQIKYYKANKKSFLVQHVEQAGLRNLVMSFHRLEK